MTDTALLDPKKRVSYSLGMVLGEDEFLQEQEYFLARDALHQRLLHGYGVACGLAVRQQTGPDGPEVVVEPGRGVTPSGRTIHVDEAQCARLNAWLLRNPQPAGPLTLYVRLCYGECATDPIPVPGGACRSESDTTVASRIAESFRLELGLEAPAQDEATAVRAFGALLGRIVVSDTDPGPLTPAELADEVRALVDPSQGGSGPLVLRPADLEAAMRLALRVWLSEVRPGFSGCAGDGPEEDCVLLATLGFDVGPGLTVAGSVQLSYADAPVLAPGELLGELLVRFREQAGAPAAVAALAGPGAPRVVAAGVFRATPKSLRQMRPTFNKLRARGTRARFTLGFAGYDPDEPYLVHGSATGGHRFQVLSFDAKGIACQVDPPADGSDPADGNASEDDPMRLMVEISQIG